MAKGLKRIVDIRWRYCLRWPAPKIRLHVYQSSMRQARHQIWWETASWLVKAKWFWHGISYALQVSRHALGYHAGIMRQNLEREAWLETGVPAYIYPIDYEWYWMEVQGITRPFHYMNMTHRGEHLWKTDLARKEVERDN